MYAAADPDLRIRGSGLKKKLFSALGAKVVWSKNKGGGAGPSGPSPPWIRHWYELFISNDKKQFSLLSDMTLIIDLYILYSDIHIIW